MSRTCSFVSPRASCLGVAARDLRLPGSTFGLVVVAMCYLLGAVKVGSAKMRAEKSYHKVPALSKQFHCIILFGGKPPHPRGGREISETPQAPGREGRTAPLSGTNIRCLQLTHT